MGAGVVPGMTIKGPFIMFRYKRRTVNGIRVYEHRYLMAQHLGRELEFNEFVHHINGDTFDNDLKNLQLVSPSEHNSLHYSESLGKYQRDVKTPYKDGKYRCSRCREYKEATQYHKNSCRKHGINSKCIKCIREMKLWRKYR